MKSKAIGKVGFMILVMLVLIAVFAEELAPYSPFEQVGTTYAKPSAEHLLGTNDIGQDVFSELIYGTRNSLAVGFLSAVIAISIAVLIGIIAGWFGGKIDRILMKVTTVFLAIPFFPVVIILSAFSKGSVWSVSIILGLMSWPAVAQILRSETIKIKGSNYIHMIQGMGASDFYIIRKHIFRELRPLILYRGIIRVKSGILAESSMSFLGLGNPVAKSWGAIIYYAQSSNALLTGAWIWWIIPPGVCICLVNMALMMIAYGYEENTDVRTEGNV